MTEIEAKLMDYITTTFEIEPDDPDFDVTTDMFASGFVDSLGAFDILLFVEDTFHIEITQRDLTLRPMNSVQEIAVVIEDKLA